VQPDPIGLAGGLNPYQYAGGNAVRFVDRLGLQEEEDEREKLEEPLEGILARLRVEELVRDIRRYDPSFRYATIAPINYRYSSQDVGTLEDILRQYREDSACRIDYGSTPQGRPFTRHYGAESGPVRNLPGSVLDDVINRIKPRDSENETKVYFDPLNNITVVTGRGSGIVTSHPGPPRRGE